MTIKIRREGDGWVVVGSTAFCVSSGLEAAALNAVLLAELHETTVDEAGSDVMKEVLDRARRLHSERFHRAQVRQSPHAPDGAHLETIAASGIDTMAPSALSAIERHLPNVRLENRGGLWVACGRTMTTYSRDLACVACDALAIAGAEGAATVELGEGVPLDALEQGARVWESIYGLVR